jgi:uncharacterized YccA/Bax inhibitor family protein
MSRQTDTGLFFLAKMGKKASRQTDRQEKGLKRMRQAIIRYLWLVGLIGQILLDYLSYPHMVGKPGGALNTIILDSMGVFFYCGLLVTHEGYIFPAPAPRWLRYALMALCGLVVLGIVRINFIVFIGG